MEAGTLGICAGNLPAVGPKVSTSESIRAGGRRRVPAPCEHGRIGVKSTPARKMNQSS